MVSQPQTYGSIREFLDNLPSQPCIWQPENPNICVTCLRINEPVARVCSVWSQALDEAPLEEIDFEEEVKSLPSIVEIEDNFEMVDEAGEIQEAEQVVAEIDIVEPGSDRDIPALYLATDDDVTEAETAKEEPTVATVDVELVETELVKDAIEAEAIATEKVETAIQKEESAIEAVAEATDTKAEAVEGYTEAVVEEVKAAESVATAVEAEAIATEAVIEATEQITELVEKGADKGEIEEAVAELEESVDKQKEAEGTVTDAVTVEDTAAEEVETASEGEDEAIDKLEEAREAVEASSEELAEAVIHEEEATEEKEETIEAVEETEVVETERGEEPFIVGDEVSHGVYGDGTVSSVTKTGKHWTIEVDFEGEARIILGTFLTLKEISEDEQSDKEEETEEEIEADQTPSAEEKEITDESEEKEPETPEKEEPETPDEEAPDVLETVIAEAVVEEPVDHGDYEPGTRVSHAIFGVGEVKNSSPKGENYRLDIDFEDGTSKTLLSTFVELGSDGPSGKDDDSESENDEETVDGEIVEATIEEKPVEAKVADAETVEVIAEAVVVQDTDTGNRKPKGKGSSETVIDLSKPEVQDAEMVDEDD